MNSWVAKPLSVDLGMWNKEQNEEDPVRLTINNQVVIQRIQVRNVGLSLATGQIVVVVSREPVRPSFHHDSVGFAFELSLLTPPYTRFQGPLGSNSLRLHLVLAGKRQRDLDVVGRTVRAEQ